MATTSVVPDNPALHAAARPAPPDSPAWMKVPHTLPAGAAARPLHAAPGLPPGALVRPLKQESETTGHGSEKAKLTHPAGKVTAIDEETGLPIVRRDAAHTPEIENEGAKEAGTLPRQVEQNQPVAAEPRKSGTNHSDFIQDNTVPRDTDSRKVVQGSMDPGEIRASAQEQEPTLRAMAKTAAAAVPGAKLEGSRVKAADSQANKEQRGKPAATNIDNLGARISAPSREALEKLKAHLKSRLPVESEAKITTNGLNVDQFGVRTGGLNKDGKPAANQVSEVQVASPEQFAAMKKTEPLYEQQKAALAKGDQAEADRLGAEIAAAHKEARSGDEAVKTGKTGKDAAPKAEDAAKPYKFGSTQANIPPASEAGVAMAAARARIDPRDLAGDGLEKEPHVTVRYGIEGDDTAGLRAWLESQKPFTVTMGKTSSFPPSQHSDRAAVIVVPVEGPELRQMEAEIDRHGRFAERSFPDYKPHATLAYVKTEAAEKYTGMHPTAGKKLLVTAIAISGRDGKQDVVQLKGGDAAAGAAGGKGFKAGDVVALKDGRAGVVQHFPQAEGMLKRARVRLADGTMLNSVKPETLEPVAAKPVDPESGWIGVDLDGTLAHYDGFKGAEVLGPPIKPIVDHVRQMIKAGKDVRIFSARISNDPKGKARSAIEAWCRQYLGEALPVTQVKDEKMIQLYDDRAVQVEENKGRIVGGRGAERSAGEAHRQGADKPKGR